MLATLYQAWLQRHGGPESAIPAFNLGVLLATHGDSAEAESAYRRALELRPNLGSARINLGLMLERRGQAEAALEQWSAVADEAEDAGAGRDPDFILDGERGAGGDGRTHVLRGEPRAGGDRRMDRDRRVGGD